MIRSISKKIADDKVFWKNIQTLFSEKRKLENKITLEDSEENILSDDTLVSEELNNFFQNATKTFIDRNVKFNHILKQCKKADTKLSALTRICKFMSLRRRRALMKSFIES